MKLPAMLAEAESLSSLLTSIERALASPVTILFLVGIAIMWVFAAVLLVRGHRVGKRLQALQGVKGFVELRSSLEGMELHTLASNLREFEEHLVELGKSRHKSLRRYLTEDAVYPDIRCASFWGARGVTWLALEELPSWFVGVGILGTFVGVSLALGALDATDAQTITGSIPQTITSLSTAFWVSIFAVGSSLLLQWMVRLVENRLSEGLHVVIERVDRAIPSGRPDVLEREQLTIKKRQHDALREQVDVLRKLNRLQRRQNKLAQTNNATLAQVKREAEESRASLQQLLEDMPRRFEGSLNSTFTAHLVQPLTSMVDAVKTSAAQASTVSQDSAKQFTEAAMKHLGGGLQEHFEGLGTSIQGFASKFEVITAQLETSMSDTKNVVGQQSALLHATVQTAERLRVEQMQAMQGLKQVPAMVEQLGLVSQQIGASLQNAGAVQERQASLHAQVKVDVDQAAAAFSASGASLAQVMQQLTPAVDSIAHSLAALAVQTDAVTNRMGDAEGEIERHIGRATEMLKIHNEVAKQFGVAFHDGKKVVDGLSRVSLEMGGAASRLADTAVPLASTASQLARVATHLESHANTLDGVTNALSEVSESTVQWADASTAAVQEFQQALVSAVTGSLHAYDGSLTAAVKGFQSSFAELEERAEQLARDAAIVSRAVQQSTTAS